MSEFDKSKKYTAFRKSFCHRNSVCASHFQHRHYWAAKCIIIMRAVPTKPRCKSVCFLLFSMFLKYHYHPRHTSQFVSTQESATCFSSYLQFCWELWNFIGSSFNVVFQYVSYIHSSSIYGYYCSI